MQMLFDDGISWIRVLLVHVIHNVNGARTLKLEAPGCSDPDVLPSLWSQTVGLSPPRHHRMDGALVKPETDVPLQLEAEENASPPSPFEESLLDLCNPSVASSSGIHSQIPEDIVVLRVLISHQNLKGLGCLFAAGDEPSLIRVDFQSSLSEVLPQGAVRQDCLSCDIVRI